MIRTNVVKLSKINGIAFRQKLLSGGSGIVILREDSAQPGIASISKTSGEPIPTTNTSKKLFPLDAFREAIALTAGLPYRKQGKVQLKGESQPEEPTPEEQAEEEAVVDSAEYDKIVAKYTDKNGKLSYSLLNRDMINFAHYSFASFRYLATPDTVPPVPTPATKMSTLPSVCCQISGPVVL